MNSNTSEVEEIVTWLYSSNNPTAHAGPYLIFHLNSYRITFRFLPSTDDCSVNTLFWLESVLHEIRDGISTLSSLLIDMCLVSLRELRTIRNYLEVFLSSSMINGPARDCIDSCLL